MFSIHNYFRKLRVRPKKDRVTALTEFGGYSYRDPDHSMYDIAYSYKNYESREAMMEGLEKLWRRQLIPNVRKGLSASVYTQVSDVEEEVNGLLTYDRRINKLLQ